MRHRQDQDDRDVDRLEGHAEARLALEPAEQQPADGQPAGEAQQGQVERLAEHEPQQCPVGVAHRLERGELRQAVGDLGEEHLVADRQPDDEPHRHADVEDHPDRRDLLPEVLLLPHQLGLGQHDDVRREPHGHRLLDPDRVRAGLDPQHAQIDRRQAPGGRRAARAVAQQVPLAHDERAVAPEVGAQREAADHPHASAVDFGLDAGVEPAIEAELGSLVGQGRVRALPGGTLTADVLEGEQVAARVEAEQADRPRQAGHRVCATATHPR